MSTITEAVEKLVKQETEKLHEDGARYRKLTAIIIKNLRSTERGIKYGCLQGDYSFAFKRHVEQQALLELLEELDCGSIGGFSPELQARKRYPTLKDRIDFIVGKYGEVS